MPFALPEPRHPDPLDAPSLRWGIIAPGRIAVDFTHALQRHTTQRVVAVSSRSLQRAAAFAAALGLAEAYDSAAELVADPSVDVVYVAAPHALHERFALLAIEGGKHVLVEKPLAMDAPSAQRIADAARSAGVFVMEGMWTRYLPQMDVARQLLEDGALGDVATVTADFGGVSRPAPGSRMFDPAQGGGALLDIGVYPISFASFAMGPPTAVIASGSMSESGVDDQVALILTSAQGAQALLSTGLRARTPSRATITGDAGGIEIGSPFWASSSITVYGAKRERLAHWTDPVPRPFREGMAFEAAALARFVSEGHTDSPLHPLHEAVTTLAVIDEARSQLLRSLGDETMRGGFRITSV